jgi:hypothetical protein
VGVPREIKKKTKGAEPMDVDDEGPRFDQDKIIEDLSSPDRKTLSGKNVLDKVTEDKIIEKKSPHKSAISAHINPFKVPDHVLNSKVELAVGEVFGISHKLLNLLADSMKFKSQQGAIGLTMSFRTKTRGLLIKLSMECNRIPIEAIIDTSSELNIVSEKICNSKI